MQFNRTPSNDYYYYYYYYSGQHTSSSEDSDKNVSKSRRESGEIQDNLNQVEKRQDTNPYDHLENPGHISYSHYYVPDIASKLNPTNHTGPFLKNYNELEQEPDFQTLAFGESREIIAFPFLIGAPLLGYTVPILNNMEKVLTEGSAKEIGRILVNLVTTINLLQVRLSQHNELQTGKDDIVQMQELLQILQEAVQYCNEKNYFIGADLSGIDNPGLELIDTSGLRLNLTGSSFCFSNLEGANFSDTDLTKSYFQGANLTNTRFTGSILPPTIQLNETWYSSYSAQHDDFYLEDDIIGNYSGTTTTSPTDISQQREYPVKRKGTCIVS